MTPDIDVRLRSVIKAIEQVLLPALDPNNPLAHEQANMVLGHLNMILGQSRYQTDYVAECLAAITQLGADLVRAADGGAATAAAAAALGDELRATASAHSGPSHALPRRRQAIGLKIDDLIEASAVDGSKAFRDALRDLVLEYGLRQSARDRAWYKASKLDPDYKNLPEISELVPP